MSAITNSSNRWQPRLQPPTSPAGAGDSLLAVPTIADLIALDSTLIDDGGVVAVKSILAEWMLDKTSVDAVDGITIVAANPIGRWYRMSSTASHWLIQTTWHLDATTGDDEADGLTALKSLKTHAELMRRVAGGVFPNVINVYLHGNFAEDWQVTWKAAHFLAYPQMLVVYHGEQTVLYSGAVTTVQAYNPAAAHDGWITDAAIPVSWTASGLVGKLIIPTSGTALGAQGWIAADLGAKKARFSPLWDWTAYAEKTPTIADTFDIVDVTQIVGYARIECDGLYVVEMDDVAFSSGTNDATLRVNGPEGSEFRTLRCQVAGNRWAVQCSSWDAQSCLLGPSLLRGVAVDAGLWLSGCCVMDWLSTERGGEIDVFASSICQGVGVIGSLYMLDDLGVFDILNAADRALMLGLWAFPQWAELGDLIWGTGNTFNYAIEVTSGNSIRYTVTPTVAGAVVKDVLIGTIADNYAGLPIVDMTRMAGMVPE